MQLAIYLALTAVGFYLGRYVGAVGLVLIYFMFFHSRQIIREREKTVVPKTCAIPSWAFRVLGVSENADIKTIKKIRKQLLNQYHPDKLGAVTPAELKAAEQTIHEINQAYQAIKKFKGFQ